MSTETTIGTAGSDAGPRFSLVLLKNEGFLWGTTYFLEKRRSDDPHHPGRLGLFGGTLEQGETFRECAVREVREETGIELVADDLVPLLRVRMGDGVSGQGESVVFVHTFRGWSQISARKTRNARRQKRAKHIDAGDKPGDVQKLSLWSLRFLDWTTLTPIAACTLIADRDRSKN